MAIVSLTYWDGFTLASGLQDLEYQPVQHDYPWQACYRDGLVGNASIIYCEVLNSTCKIIDRK